MKEGIVLIDYYAPYTKVIISCSALLITGGWPHDNFESSFEHDGARSAAKVLRKYMYFRFRMSILSIKRSSRKGVFFYYQPSVVNNSLF